MVIYSWYDLNMHVAQLNRLDERIAPSTGVSHLWPHGTFAKICPFQRGEYEYGFMSLSAQSWQNRDRWKLEAGTMPYSYFRMTSRVLYSAQYHRQQCTLHASEQFGPLYIHNHDDKYPARPGLEPGTSRLQAPVDTNEPSGPGSTRRTSS